MESQISYIFISSKPWYSGLGGTAKSLATELGKTNRTYYINSPIDRFSLLKFSRAKEIKDHLAKISTGKQLIPVSNQLYEYYPSVVMESINWIPFKPLFNLLNYLNNRKLAGEIKKLIRKEALRHYVIINDKDIFRGYYLKELLQPVLYVYLDRDFVLGVPYWAKHGIKLEPRLMKKSDLVLCNSIPFTDLALERNLNSHFIGNGCDLKTFDGAVIHPKPNELNSLPGKIIGYAGALVSLRLDIRLLEKIAEHFPEYSFVFIGQEDEDFKSSGLHQLKNVHFLGFKPFASLPAFYQHFDVCINIQVNNNVTSGNYPMKIDEYLAMGKPVVATKTKAMEYFQPHVYLADSLEEFIENITRAANDNDPISKSERMKFAGAHSWPAITAHVASLIHQTIKSKNRKHNINADPRIN